MKSFEYYYQREFDYLRQLAKIVSEENPHLRDVLGGGDPDVERLFEGASVLTARHWITWRSASSLAPAFL
ncbi:type VI secretion system baseplate subunit TssF [Xenorhabdus bovienii]|uniref:Putative type VI secretion protein VasA n=1 Tax=Xenorhabdus bovienii TaxID=40576 RepID=A0A0B6X3X0_XENBV|nr:type VI secretion system baseplate subunit TssF [Xenorhabdus bovienii]CDM87836.1 Putative type VI secretion protein VasA [Xenorhabdus bovienii]